MKKILLFIVSCCLLLTFNVYAKPITVSLYLKNIKAIKLNERNKDEVYFSIADFSSNKDNRFYTMPGFVTHQHPHFVSLAPTGTGGHIALYWSSKHFKQLKHEKLWSRQLKNNQSVEIYLSVIERDSPPWDFDDAIGAIKIKMKNHDGKIIAVWGNLGSEKVTQINSSKNNTGEMKGFLFQGSNSKYEIHFHLMYTSTTK